MDYSAVRRDLHQIPEPGFEEFKTQTYLLRAIETFPQDHLIVKTWRTGILVKIKGTSPQKTIGFRCDIDGLPITEETDYDFQSKHEGFMHACGHDFHMTIALGVLEKLAFQPPENDVVIIFQPAEEGPGGAVPLMKSEVFNEWRPDAVFALHVAPDQPAGAVAIREGLLFANTSELFIDFNGKGGHAAFPHLTDDMVVAASAFIMGCQTIISRAVNPVDSGVITFGKVESGSRQNVIAGAARVEGTIRALLPETMDMLKSRIKEHMKAIEIAYHCKADIDFGSNYYQVYNSREMTQAFIRLCQKNGFQLETCDAQMTGEDFGYFLKDIPGFMFWLGVNSEEGLHSSKLKPDESALAKGVDIVTETIRSGFQFLKE